jgi:hypothetical protein
MTSHPQSLRYDSKRLEEAMQEANYLHSSLENGLSLIVRILEEGDHDGHVGIPALVDLSRRAVSGWQDKYPDAFVAVGSHLQSRAGKEEVE